jgi:hypothetical protein
MKEWLAWMDIRVRTCQYCGIFQHKIVSEEQQGREAYLPIQNLSFGYDLENHFSSRADWGNIRD